MWTQKITRSHRIMVLICAVLMSIVYLVPLWRIHLGAPQYPEGLSMYIWTSNISGGDEFDIQNINLLNHYIGMNEITPDAIPELKYMPYVLGFMIFGAIMTVIIPRLFMVLLGIINTILVAVVGLADFWHWEYVYGHNLKPDAAIQVPGMTYQPPLLACKEMLNITACSWPHGGVALIVLSMAILVYVVYEERKNRTV